MSGRFSNTSTLYLLTTVTIDGHRPVSLPADTVDQEGSTRRHRSDDVGDMDTKAGQ